MNIVEDFETRKQEVEAQLEAIESGRIIRLIYEPKEGAIDVTDLARSCHASDSRRSPPKHLHSTPTLQEN